MSPELLTDPLAATEDAITRRLRALSLPGTDLMVLLAADHRQNLRKQLPDELTPSEAARRLTELKLAFARHLGSAATGYLTDPEYGLGPCLSSGDVDARLPIIAALERTGYVGTGFERMPELVDGFDPARAATLGVTAAKFLVYYHPDAPNAGTKRELCRTVAERCRAAGLPLFLEPLVHPIAADRPLPPGSDEFEDAVIRTVAELSSTGPTMMKVQFPGGGPDHRPRWEEACARLDAASITPWVLLSAGVEFDDFLAQTEAACAAGASGVLVGRAVWGDAVALAAAERARFLETTARDRLDQLRAVVGEHGRGWRSPRRGGRGR